jgi:hypothetical protein
MTATLLKQLQDSLNRDALAFLPELVLCGAIVLMLLLRLFHRFDNKHLGWVALLLVGYAFVISCQQWFGIDPSVDPRVSGKAMDIFSGMLVFVGNHRFSVVAGRLTSTWQPEVRTLDAEFA